MSNRKVPHNNGHAIRQHLSRHQIFHSEQPRKLEGDDNDSEHDCPQIDNDWDINDDDSLSIHSELFDENSHDASGDWTLQSFMDHQQHASYLNGNSKRGVKRTVLERQLSLASAHSNSPAVSPLPSPGNNNNDDAPTAEGAAGGVMSPNKGPATLVTVASSLTTLVSGEYNVPIRRRRMLPKLLLLVCAALLFAISSSSTNMLSGMRSAIIFHQQKSIASQTKVNDNTAKKKSNDNHFQKEDEDFHPLFQHSQRTADVEVPAPAPLHKDSTTLTAGGGSNNNKSGGSIRSGSSSNTSHRRLQENVSLFSPDKNENSESVLFNNVRQGTTPAEGVESDGSGSESTSTFIQGDVVQELCPATHTLISQSLILRSSYGNIFSITTPANPNGNTRRDTEARSSPQQRDGSSSVGEENNENDTNDDNDDDGLFLRHNRKLQNANTPNYADTGDYNDIDTETESIYNGTSIETITIKTLSLRMADYRPTDKNAHFEVWLYTGSGDNIEKNENDLDEDPTNDNLIVPSKGEYQGSRAKFTDWFLMAEGKEEDLVPDLDFFDHNGHIFNIGAGTTIGPLGRLDGYENMEDVTLAAKEWNEGKIRGDGGMDAITAEGEVTTTFFYKIPEEKFTPLILPKYNGKLTLFVTLDRVGLQYGYAAKQEFDKVDVMKHDYIDQTPSLDVLNGNVNMRMHVGEGVIFYPWMEEEFFYQTRRFLGKIWYDAEIPCEYVTEKEVLGEEELTPSMSPSQADTSVPSMTPSTMPSVNGTIVAADVLVSVFIMDGPLPIMPYDVKEIFEQTLLDFVKDEFGDFCPLTWNEDATVTEQEVAPIGGLPTGTTAPGRKRRDGSDHAVSEGREPDEAGGSGRYLRRLFEPIFYPPPKPARNRLLQAITVLDANTTIEALYSSNSCPDKTPKEFATLIEEFINDNKDDFVEKLKAAHDYFADAFAVSADAILPVEVVAPAIVVEEEEPPIGAIVGGIMAALILCCFCCCLPFLIIRRRKRKEEAENEIIGEDIEWAHPVDQDHFPPLGGYRDDEGVAGGDGSGEGVEASKLRKRPDGDFPEPEDTGPDLVLNPIPPGLRPPEDDTDMLHDTRWLDKDTPEAEKKQRPFGLPGMPDDDDEPDPYNINIYPGGDYEEEEGDPDGHNLRHVEKETTTQEDEDWSPEHYEPDGGLHSYDRPVKPPADINAKWNRLPEKEAKAASPKKKLSIKELVLQRKKDLDAKMAAMRHVEAVQAGLSDDESQVFPKAEPDSRIEDLMSRIKDLEKDRTKKYQRKTQFAGESDYEIWRRLNIGDDELSSSSESSDDDVNLTAAKRRKKKKKKRADDYMLKFDDLEAYNRALAVHQDAYIHKWVKVKVEKGDEENEGAIMDDVEMEGSNHAMGDEDAGVEVDRQGRPDLSRDMNTRHIGDLGDEDAGVDEGKPAAVAASGTAAKAMPGFDKQPTEDLGEDKDDSPAGATALSAAVRRSKLKQEEIVRGMDDEDAPQDVPADSEKTEYNR